SEPARSFLALQPSFPPSTLETSRQLKGPKVAPSAVPAEQSFPLVAGIPVNPAEIAAGSATLTAGPTVWVFEDAATVIACGARPGEETVAAPGGWFPAATTTIIP